MANKDKKFILRKDMGNGVFYVYERTYTYDPKSKNNKTKDRLLYKEVNGVRQETRRRRTRQEILEAERLSGISAERKRTGSKEILDHIAEKSGIDDAVYAAFGNEIDDAKKCISMARYLVCSGGNSFPGIKVWMMTHAVPYTQSVLTKDTCKALMDKIGLHYDIVEKYFKERIKWCKCSLVIAYDSTTEATDSTREDNARYGFNKDRDGRRTIKALYLYSMEDHQPIAFSREPGNLSDAASVMKAVKQLEALGVKVCELVMDNGYYSFDNVGELLYHRFNVTILVKTGLNWVKDAIDDHYSEFGKPSTYCCCDDKENLMSGVTVKLKLPFHHICEHSDRRTGAKKGEPIEFEKEVYLHLYRNETLRKAKLEKLISDVKDIMQTISETHTLDVLDERSKDLASQCLVITADKEGNVTAEGMNDDGIEKLHRYDGFMAVLSDSDGDSRSVLRKYRSREHIEDNMWIKKSCCDGSTPRSWYDYAHNGRLFIQFLAMGYYDCLYEILGKMRGKINSTIADFDKAEVPSDEKKLWRSLKSWMHNNSLNDILQYFDVYETSRVSTEIRRKIWTTGYTERDKLFLKLLKEYTAPAD